MVTRTDKPSGPVEVNATSPAPGAELHPSGSGTVSLGATGFDTEAGVIRPSPVDGGKHARALGGIWSGSVVSTPGTGSAGSDRRGAPDVVGDAVFVGDDVALARIAVPPVVFPHPPTHASTQNTPAAASGMGLARRDRSVARKRKRKFGFHVVVGPAGQIDGDRSDGAAGEGERRLVPAGY